MNVQKTPDMSAGVSREPPADDCCGGRRTGDEAGCCGSHGGQGDKCCRQEASARDGSEQPRGTSVVEGRLVVP